MFPQETWKVTRKIQRKKAATVKKSENGGSEKKTKGKKFCKYYCTCGHTTDVCIALKDLIGQAKKKKGN